MSNLIKQVQINNLVHALRYEIITWEQFKEKMQKVREGEK